MVSWKRLAVHVAFWLTAGFFLVFFIGKSDTEVLSNAVIVTLLLPVAVLTSWQFNHRLIPRYLWTSQFRLFALYGVFTVVLSLWVTMMIVLGTFIFLAEYQLDRLTPVSRNVLILGVALYFLVLLNVVIFLTRRWSQPKDQITHIKIRSDRKTVPLRLDQIYYIESLSNYVKIHTDTRNIITKESISHLEKRLNAHDFVRIHRSYLVNRSKITSFSNESVEVKKQLLNIGRAFKKEALNRLNL